MPLATETAEAFPALTAVTEALAAHRREQRGYRFSYIPQTAFRATREAVVKACLAAMVERTRARSKAQVAA